MYIYEIFCIDDNKMAIIDDNLIENMKTLISEIIEKTLKSFYYVL